MYYIQIEELAANALIEVLENYQRKVITFEALTEYGDIVVSILKEKNKDVVFQLSNSSDNNIFHDYTDYFTVTDKEITLKDGVTIDMLKDAYRSNISFDVFLAFIDKKALAVFKDAA